MTASLLVAKDISKRFGGVQALAEVSFTNKKTGRTFVSPKADLWRFAHRKATEFYEYYDTASVFAAAQP